MSEHDLTQRLKDAARRVVPSPVTRAMKRTRRSLTRAIQPIGWDNLRSLEPVSRNFGFERGEPVDRHYIEGFLRDRQADIRGCVLEIANPRYTERFGGDRVTKSEVLHVCEGNPRATLVGDFSTGEGIPSEQFDCIIFTQTIQFIFDLHATMRHLHRALRPGGVLLITAAGIAPISRTDMDSWGEFWRFTSASLRRLLATQFSAENIAIETYGNVLTAVSILQGITSEELTAAELDFRDPDYEVTICARAMKA